jgi:hypothetical protein
MMRISNPILLILAILTLIVQSKGQSPQQNLDKYWNYRNRFFDNFIVDVDPNSLPEGMQADGINIPAGRINDYRVHWGESPMKIGYYLSAMATEYELLHLNNLDSTIAQEKIYRALDAVNRLDSYAEPFFGCGVLGDPTCYNYTNMNGFFIRDDVDSAFVDDWNPYLPSWIENQFGASSYTNPDPRKNEMSQDQFIGVMMGHALVKRFVEATDTYEDFPCDYRTLKEIAKRQTFRSIKYMQTWHDLKDWTWKIYGDNDYPGKWVPGLNLIPLLPPMHTWKIKNPCTGWTVLDGGALEDIYPHHNILEDAGNWLTEESFGSLNYFAINPLIIPFDLYIDLPLPSLGEYYNSRMKLELSTIANDHYASNLDELFWNIRKCADEFNEDISDNPYDVKYFWLENLPMMSVLLHNIDPQSSDLFFYYYSHVEQLLNDAPADGIVCSTYPPPGYIWETNSMFDRPIGVYLADSGGYRPGMQNGLDYMILFNLYHLVYKLNFDDPITITEDFPTTYEYDSHNFEYGNEVINIGHENNAATLTYHSKDLITMNSTVNANGKVCLRGNEVLLQPGFEVKYAGEFTAETNNIMELDFTPPTGNYKSAKVDQSPSFVPIISEDRRDETLKDYFESSSVNQFRVYPNPATSMVYIESQKNISSIAIYNSIGTVVHQTCTEGYELMSLDVSGYHPGFYIITLTADDGSIEKSVLVIE